MSEVREYLITKKADLQNKLQPLSKMRDEQRKGLAITEAAMNSLLATLEELNAALDAIIAKEQEAKTPKPKLTIKGAVLSVLRDKPQGLTSGEILNEINTRYFDGTIKRESLSPQLTRLKRDDRKIDLKGERWLRLPQENEANLFATKS
jgi:hypothetical protein